MARKYAKKQGVRLVQQNFGPHGVSRLFHEPLSRKTQETLRHYLEDAVPDFEELVQTLSVEVSLFQFLGLNARSGSGLPTATKLQKTLEAGDSWITSMLDLETDRVANGIYRRAIERTVLDRVIDELWESEDYSKEIECGEHKLTLSIANTPLVDPESEFNKRWPGEIPAGANDEYSAELEIETLKAIFEGMTTSDAEILAEWLWQQAFWLNRRVMEDIAAIHDNLQSQVSRTTIASGPRNRPNTDSFIRMIANCIYDCNPDFPISSGPHAPFVYISQAMLESVGIPLGEEAVRKRVRRVLGTKP